MALEEEHESPTRSTHREAQSLSPRQGDRGATTWQAFSSFFTKGAGKERGRKLLQMAAPGPFDKSGDYVHQPVDAYGEMRKKIAIKCDLCAGYDNQACVQACPTGAAIRVQPTAFFGSTEEILRRRAR